MAQLATKILKRANTLIFSAKDVRWEPIIHLIHLKCFFSEESDFEPIGKTPDNFDNFIETSD